MAFIGITFRQYSADVRKLERPKRGRGVLFPAMTLSVQAAKVVETIQSIWTSRGATEARSMTDVDRRSLRNDLAKVLLAVDQIADELDLSLEEVALELMRCEVPARRSIHASSR